MKKVLIGLLVVALTVVGCQNYDDQFDSLNDKITALSGEVTTLKGISTTVATLSTKLDGLIGSALSESDLKEILDEVNAVKATVAAIDNSGIEAEVANLDTEVETILEKLGDLLSANAFYEGNLVIKNLGQLANAHEMIKTGADDPTITVKGDVDIVVGGASGVTKDSIASVQLILSKLRSIQGTATLTTESTADLPALTYVTGNVALNGVDGKANITAGKLLTIDGNMTITGLTGAISLPTLGSVGNVNITEVAGKATVTTVDFSGMTSGKVETTPGNLVLAGATSVKLGGELPAVVTLNACTEFMHGGAVAQPALDLTLGGAAATMSIAATSFTGEVTITTKGNINLPSVTKIVKTQLIAQTAASEAHLPALTEVAGHLDISDKFTTIDLSALKTATASMSIHGVVAVSLPELAGKTGQVTMMIACPVATTFSAPKLDTTSSVIDLKAAVDHISILNLADVTTPTNDIVEWAATKKITVAAQKGNLDVSAATALVDLEFTGFKNTPVGEDNQTNILTITGANTNLKTLVIGATSALKTLNVTTTVLTNLTTAGEIINCNVSNNAALATFDFAHTHLQGDRESKVDITNNDKVKSVDMSSLSKVGTVTVTGNADLATLVAPSTTVLATAGAPIAVNISANKLTGTYTKAIKQTGTVTYTLPAITSAALSSFKPWIIANIDVDISDPIGGATAADIFNNRDRTHAATGDAAYATGSGTTGEAVTFNIDIDKVDVVGTTAVETDALSVHMNGDAAGKEGQDGTAGNADDDVNGNNGVTSYRELLIIAD